MNASLNKLAALGAYAVSAGLVAVLAFFIWLMWPVRTGGMNATVDAVGILCVACPVILLIAIHIALARQLTRPG
jgi:hypothetical protein